ncbi:hypothetical protein GCM10009745_31020 [Kribbella yunnanensis]|uniref:DUF2207 domain-containing protein n=1 Tax=Kribbella yunnanensis TaxID=190194 RepID=A0ABP4T9F4_9ACTN
MKSRIAAVMAAGTCAVLTLAAPAASAADDVTAPVQVSADAGAFFRNAASVTLKYAFKDPGTEEEPGSGLADYDVRYQEEARPAGVRRMGPPRGVAEDDRHHRHPHRRAWYRDLLPGASPRCDWQRERVE